MTFMEKLLSGYYSSNGFDYVSASEAKNDSQKAYERERYLADGRKRHQEFIDESLGELELVNHPKAQKLFDKAWEMGHSSGYSEVWNYMLDLAELIK